MRGAPEPFQRRRNRADRFKRIVFCRPPCLPQQAKQRDHFAPLKQNTEIVGAFLTQGYPATAHGSPLKRNAAKTMCWNYCTSTAALKSHRDRDGIYAAH